MMVTDALFFCLWQLSSNPSTVTTNLEAPIYCVKDSEQEHFSDR